MSKPVDPIQPGKPLPAVINFRVPSVEALSLRQKVAYDFLRDMLFGSVVVEGMSDREVILKSYELADMFLAAATAEPSGDEA